jgi:hypothetical protein
LIDYTVPPTTAPSFQLTVIELVLVAPHEPIGAGGGGMGSPVLQMKVWELELVPYEFAAVM